MHAQDNDIVTTSELTRLIIASGVLLPSLHMHNQEYAREKAKEAVAAMTS